ncbi:uncharacterized protein M421DRAFT_419176 [Didymella exigua CBS 183.55]|uniref:Uncharacterized protein n=1 Tax=Didymella exigua CBS 183.55 TaxID=1150837 RepID=A0A6A5RQR8_9PLEO|nr:uncharacterized protein M421DRAFT_419176 [Didymella exigua CBS 183.55]KAF1930132.1 hypothetical protein M421DRAFT_419176 [Didymella exigua CBS 183.55]
MCKWWGCTTTGGELYKNAEVLTQSLSPEEPARRPASQPLRQSLHLPSLIVQHCITRLSIGQ